MPENNNKDPIENLFRKKAEEYDISYREEDWLKLEQQLEQQERHHATQKRRWLVAAAVLLLFSLLGYAVYQNYQGINRINEQLSDQNNTETLPEDFPDTPKEQDDSEEKTAKNHTDNRSEPQSDISDNNEIIKEKPHPSTTESNKGNRSDPENFSASDEPRISDAAIPQISVDKLSCTTCQLSNLADRQKEQSNLELTQETKTHPHAMAAQEKSATDFSERKSLPQPAASRAAIGLVAGPDLSTVDSFSDFHQPGYNLGLLFEYRLNSAFSIRGGLVRSSVHYVADGSEYHPPSGFWSYDTVPDQTTAQCIILDIPVSLKYEFWHFDRSRLYATAGLNSYIMLNEDYQFDYESSNSHLVQRWNDRTGTRHWMSNANISIGYAFDLNPHLSFQIEPFLKIPVREVGWGNVKLHSMGSLISLNYKLH